MFVRAACERDRQPLAHDGMRTVASPDEGGETVGRASIRLPQMSNDAVADLLQRHELDFAFDVGVQRGETIDQQPARVRPADRSAHTEMD
jgi:hypothetical protein